MTSVNNTRYILVHSEKCGYSCPNCYYKFRNHTTEKNSGTIDEFVSYYNPSNVAIGFNSGHYDNEIDMLRNTLNYDVDIVATVSLDPLIIINTMMYMKMTDTLCVSYSDVIYERGIDKLIRMMDVPDKPQHILNITDDLIVDTKELPPSFYKLANVVDSIYLLMSKGPVGRWHMTDERIRIYEKKLDILKGVTSIPVLIDECVYGIMTRGIGNCRGDWIEINSHGEVRTCPYSEDPTRTFIYGINLDEIEFPKKCECRRL